MSKTLAAEIAERVLKVVNPANRPLALAEALRRHGFQPVTGAGEMPADRSALAAWLQQTYPGDEAK